MVCHGLQPGTPAISYKLITTTLTVNPHTAGLLYPDLTRKQREPSEVGVWEKVPRRWDRRHQIYHINYYSMVHNLSPLSGLSGKREVLRGTRVSRPDPPRHSKDRLLYYIHGKKIKSTMLTFGQ
jgi:hypothetical protein